MSLAPWEALLLFMCGIRQWPWRVSPEETALVSGGGESPERQCWEL